MLSLHTPTSINIAAPSTKSNTNIFNMPFSNKTNNTPSLSSNFYLSKILANQKEIKSNSPISNNISINQQR
jgi:hypothetical protein